MTIDHPVRRLLARVCSDRTMALVVDPVLADMRWERGPRWMGYLALGRALMLHAALSFPGTVSRLWTDDERALPRAVLACTVTAVLFMTPLIAIPAQWAPELTWRAVLTLVPQALAVALPPSLLVAIPLAFRHATNTRRLIARGLALSLLCAAATVLVITRLVPDANQAFRVEASRIAGQTIHLERGPAEMTQTELRERIDVLSLTPGGVPVARRLEYVYQMKLALGAIAAPLGGLAIALAMSPRGRKRPLLLGVLSVVTYIVVMFPIDAAAGLLMVRLTIVPPAVFAWAPVAIVMAIAGLALRVTMPRLRATSA
jgi:hypothetical protein